MRPRPGHPGEFIADVVPPPEQLELFDVLGDNPRPGQLRLFRDSRQWRRQGERRTEAQRAGHRYVPRPHTPRPPVRYQSVTGVSFGEYMRRRHMPDDGVPRWAWDS
jgi:hypothetical protein